MFNWKKDAKAEPKTRPRPGGKQAAPTIGLLDVPDFADMGNLDLDEDFGDDEAELEAELSALQAGYDIRKVIARKPLNMDETPATRNARKEFQSGEDEDDDVNENDPELLAELNCLESVNVPVPAAPPPRPPPRPAPNIPSVPVAKPKQLPTMSVSASATQPAPKLPVVSPPLNSSAVTTNRGVVGGGGGGGGGGTIVDMLQERLQNYKTAQENAKTAEESAKVRRLARGLKTLETMLKSARAGKPIVEEDIPPPVAVGGQKPKAEPPKEEAESADGYSPPEFSRPLLPSLIGANPPPLPPRTRTAPPPPHNLVLPPIAASPQPAQAEDPSRANTLIVLATRRDQYRQAAKRETKETQIREYLKIAKKFDMVITAMEQGQEVDLQGMPPPPPPFFDKPSTSPATAVALPKTVRPSAPPPPTSLEPASTFNRDQPLELPTTDEADDPSVFNAPPPTSSTMEALQQRLQKYRSSLEEATGAGNESKARRMGRIVKQYETAIKQYKAGKPIAFDDLPTPPGFAPIPTNSSSGQPKGPAPSSAKPISAAPPPGQQLPRAPPNPARGAPTAHPESQPPSAAPRAPPPPPKPAQKSPQSLYEKQCNAIQERQRLFKVAALEAKKRGDVQAAKEYLRLAKGFEPMISASKCGFPVNMDSLPLPPQLSNETSFEMISAEDCEQVGAQDEMYEKLEKDLVTQIEMCAKNKSHFSSLGDVNNSQKFETMLLNTKKDLNFLRQSLKRGEPVPRFHYETRTFSIVKCCTDLRDDDLELGIIKGINYACPNPTEVDTYVKYEFPFPPDACPKDKTHTVKNTNNPEYNATFKLAINRKSRNCTTAFKRKGIKLEVWAKGGFLRNDVLLGTATVKLMPLETRCILHDSYDLMEGRKPTGGKLEVKVRLRDPIMNKQVETHCEKWLIVNASHIPKTA